MLVSYKWLNELVDLSVTADELADKMSRTGIEVEEVNVPEEGLKKIVVGDVKECEPHPDSDHLSICQVDVGEEELSQIVCGAPNIKAGKKVIVALPNSRITGNVKIKKGKMRGQVSLGMICSLQELGYSDNLIPKEYADGIYFMPDEAIPGEPVFPYLEMDDAIIELSITANRADALSMRGVAHEVGAIYRQKPVFPTKELIEDNSAKIADYLTVKVEEVTDTPNYRMRVVKDVTVKESPLWLQTRLMNEGIRPISNVVDVTNYVLLLFGQPMHAFDYDKIGSKEIVVRRARDEEVLKTLDGEERRLTPANIVITNGQEPIALAGVMGGYDSEIVSTTTTVALEAATFEPITTRLTSKQFGLRSESSSRFEKGINLETVQEACDFAAAMVAELGEGTVVSGEIVASETKAPKVEIDITLTKINRSLGTDLTAEIVGEIFEALGFPFTVVEGAFTVNIPARRWDITIEADLVEEVARIYGYDNLPSTLPSGEALPGALTRKQQLVRTTQTTLEGSGLTEAISYALTTEAKAIEFVLEQQAVVKLQSPMSEDHAVLRQNLTSGLLTDLAYNVARKNSDVALFEIGNVFSNTDSGQMPTEGRHLGMAITGAWADKTWQVAKTPVDFYLLKGIFENLLEVIGADSLVTFEPTADLPALHPGRTAKIIIDGQAIGFIGQIHPLTAKEYSINETYVLEVDLDCLFDQELVGIDYEVVSKFPSMKRDIALLVDTTVSNQELVTVIKGHGGKFLQTVQLFDIFQGEKLGAGKKSMAYSLSFQNPEATLIDDEVTAAMAKIENALVNEYSVEIR
ncbi:phenylalanine--tRNA ligase subunit beta [Vagococcus sp. BWB3-3]|uniref:Phenylalanine--tRNA ligase beta subunit n=1 Tax=Vagococcus allomyrinae TaxID=2794353 RepID=A0A940PBC6_9ENTE|nr:phenylalanine--tRNA ligase subunit beta [Vagococcus allomyrinae]MBP1041844.1 phenylalanine--tRNA ligase subunit beta [Vagococcus allomyrinae]